MYDEDTKSPDQIDDKNPFHTRRCTVFSSGEVCDAPGKLIYAKDKALSGNISFIYLEILNYLMCFLISKRTIVQ